MRAWLRLFVIFEKHALTQSELAFNPIEFSFPGNVERLQEQYRCYAMD